MSKIGPARKNLGSAGSQRESRATYSLEVVAQLAGVHLKVAKHYWKQGLFGPDADKRSKAMFDDDALYELRRLEHYRQHYGMDSAALPLITRLLRDVARLEAEVRFLKD